MKKISILKFTLLVLLFISTTSIMFIYISNITNFDTYKGQSSTEPLVFKVHKDDENIILTRLIDIERQNNLQQICHRDNYVSMNNLAIDDNVDLLSHIIVDTRHKLLYCYVPKVACTNWKKVFMILMQKTNITNLDDIPASLAHNQGMFMKLVNYSSTEINYFLRTYTKFIFVRHPFERLLSAYRNKLEQHYKSSQYFQERYGRYIVKNFRSNPSLKSLEKGDDVSFKEFAAFITSENTTFNEHWMQINTLCQPCLINYDIIGKYETLHQDAEFVLKHIGHSDVNFPKLKKPSNTLSKLNEYFASVPQDIIDRLYNLYRLDFQLFGYEKPEFVSNISVLNDHK